MNKFMTGMVAAGALALSAQANATVFDFVQIADGADYGDLSSSQYADGSPVAGDLAEAAFDALIWTVDGITLTATGTATSGDEAWAYLDQKSSGKPAGLGVCSQGLKTDSKGPHQCDPGSDDNVTFGEWLNIGFSEDVLVDLGASIFRDGDHNIHSDDHAVEISFDSGATWALVTGTNDVFTTSAFSLRVEENVTDLNKFYLDALAVNVAEPATVALLGLGLAGLGAVRRRKA